MKFTAGGKTSPSRSISASFLTWSFSRAGFTSFIEGGMRRGSQYLPMIQQVFRTEGLPLDLAYVPLIESAFRTEALSRASAKGVWQFMKGTALENGLKHDWYVDERSDPHKATVAAANYLKALAERLAAIGIWPSRPTTAVPAAFSEPSSGWPDRLLVDFGEDEGVAPRNARVRADDPRGDRDRPESGAVRVFVRIIRPGSGFRDRCRIASR